MNFIPVGALCNITSSNKRFGSSKFQGFRNGIRTDSNAAGTAVSDQRVTGSSAFSRSEALRKLCVCGERKSLLVNSESIMKLTVLCLVLLVAGCGAVSSQSIYEGLRTQQSVKDAGVLQPSQKMGTYDGYEKDREKLKLQK